MRRVLGGMLRVLRGMLRVLGAHRGCQDQKQPGQARWDKHFVQQDISTQNNQSPAVVDSAAQQKVLGTTS